MKQLTTITSRVLALVALPSCSLVIDTNPDGLSSSQSVAGQAGTVSGSAIRPVKGSGGAPQTNTTKGIETAVGGTSGDTRTEGSGGVPESGGSSSTLPGATGGAPQTSTLAGSTAGTTAVTPTGGTGNGGTTTHTTAPGGTGAGGTTTLAGTTCSNSCTVGEYKCSGTTLQHCEAGANGCATLVNSQTCSGDTPVCNATAHRCDCNTAAAATCNGNSAQLVCSASSGQWENKACPSVTPACVANVGCTACTEHKQCPGSACHLSGSKQGTCFASSSVWRSTSPADMLAKVQNLSAPGELAIMIPAGSFFTGEQLLVKANQEVAIIGESSPPPTWSGNGNWSDARNAMIRVEGSAILYLGNLRQEESTPGSVGIEIADGSILWLDDFYSSGYYRALNTVGEAHVRRSYLRSATLSTIYVRAGSLFMENSTLAPMLTSAGSVDAGISTFSSSIVFDIRYSTIIGGQVAILCQSAPQPSGSIRNSVLLAWSASNSPITPECGTVNQSGNYAPTVFYTDSWFIDPNNMNFHLSAGGKAAIPKTAQWESGDPTVDIDGQARPTSGVGYPGVDQP